MNTTRRGRTSVGIPFDDPRSQRTTTLLRPTATIAAVFLLILLIVPHVDELGALFGGSSKERTTTDLFVLLEDPVRLTDFFFDKVLVEFLAMVLIFSVLRWWRLLFIEPASMRPRRWNVAIPFATAALLFVVQVLVSISTPSSSLRLMAVQLVAMLGVALVEETAWRGVALVGLRGSGFPEWAVWLLTTTGFALMHLLNLFSGADLAGTLGQLVYTFILGTACYLARRVGGLWLAIGIHFLSNSIQATAQVLLKSSMFETVNALVMVSQLLLFLALPATIVLLVVEARKNKKRLGTADGAAA